MIFPFLICVLISCGSSTSKAPDIKHYTGIDTTSHFKQLTKKEKEYYYNAITPLYKNMLLQKGFNGAILAAKNGDIVFEDYHGYANFSKKELINANTTFHLASISKTFTAMTVLRLMDEGKLNLDDNVQVYLPKFPYEGVTLKDLLTHRSGLPNYLEFMEGGKDYQYVRKLNKRGRSVLVRTGVINKGKGFEGLATNQDVLDWMVNKKPPIEARPNRVFKYCNTNYVLLALIIEKVTGIAFPQFMKDSVFTPLGMTSTFIFTKKDIANFNPSYMGKTPQRVEKFDCVYGDKCVYSTVRDMLQWDKALYEGSFVSKPSLEMAFKGYSNEHRGERNYGLGWRLLIGPDETIVYHNGWWHGNNTVFTRIIKDSATLIILGNKFNKNIYAAHKITSVFNGSVDTTSLEE